MHKAVIGYGILNQISCCYKYYFKLAALCKRRNKWANGSLKSMCTTKPVWCIRPPLHGPSAPGHTYIKTYTAYRANVCPNTGRKEGSLDGW